MLAIKLFLGRHGEDLGAMLCPKGAQLVAHNRGKADGNHSGGGGGIGPPTHPHTQGGEGHWGRRRPMGCEANKEWDEQ